MVKTSLLIQLTFYILSTTAFVYSPHSTVHLIQHDVGGQQKQKDNDETLSLAIDECLEEVAGSGTSIKLNVLVFSVKVFF